MGIQVWQERVTRKNDSAKSMSALVDIEKPCHYERQSSVCSSCEGRHQAFQQITASRSAPVDWLIIIEQIADNAGSKKLKVNEQATQLIRGILQAASVGKTAMVLPVDTSDNELSETAQGCCRQSFLEDIGTVKPRLILIFGKTVATSLLAKIKPTEQGGVLPQSIDGLACPITITHSLGELLQNPLLKKKVWADIQLAFSLKT